jgi:hypothetical protein
MILLLPHVRLPFLRATAPSSVQLQRHNFHISYPLALTIRSERKLVCAFEMG